MRLQEVADVSRAVSSTRSRLEKTARLAQLLRSLQGREIAVGVAYLSGALPQGRIGLGWAAMSDARTAGVSGEASLDLLDVDSVFEKIARTSGSGAAKARGQLLAGLFTRATRDEQDFLFRLISGELRQGALEGVLTDAVAKAAAAPVEAVRQAAMMCGNLGEVAHAALVDGPAALARYDIQLFRPVEPMLASPAESVAEALEWLGEAAFELKLDGARIQVHKAGADVRVFSRGLRDVTSAVPEIAEQIVSVAARDVILDGEVIALAKDGRPLPFQETMRRFGRRLDVDALRVELPLTPFFFDCLYLDGAPLTAKPQRERTATLVDVAGGMSVRRRTLSSRPEAEDFLREALAAGHEGLMAKSLDAPYAAGSRGRSWLKIKHAKTLDLVVLAAEWGSGRRRGWLSNLHLGARDPTNGGFVMLGKTFKGMTDEMLAWQTAAFLERETSRDGHIVFVRPELVVEIAFNDLQQSPHYPGGLALRFARVKGYRPDKTAADADTIDTVREIYSTSTGRQAPARA
jgi:ATP-dependent DNA ligase I